MFTGRLKTEIPQALVGCVACSFLGHNANQKQGIRIMHHISWVIVHQILLLFSTFQICKNVSTKRTVVSMDCLLFLTCVGYLRLAEVN